ncbi:MAG: outer membrane beta-barrel protein [Candidatus Zixiibacteriota bacterium]|jgi:opacity protein-like surface antigen
MKRLLLVLCLLLCFSQVTHAQGPRIGVGAFGGLDFPIVQDDQGQGTVFGLRARIRALPIITVEPNIAFSKYGDPDLGIPGVTNDLEGSKVTFYGVDGTFGAPFAGPGFRIFGIAGIGWYKVKRDQTMQDKTRIGYSGGLGLGFGLTPAISLDVRGKLHVIPWENGGSKKSVTTVLGINYAFGQ